MTDMDGSGSGRAAVRAPLKTNGERDQAAVGGPIGGGRRNGEAPGRAKDRPRKPIARMKAMASASRIGSAAASAGDDRPEKAQRSEEHTSELQSLMRIS